MQSWQSKIWDIAFSSDMLIQIVKSGLEIMKFIKVSLISLKQFLIIDKIANKTEL